MHANREAKEWAFEVEGRENVLGRSEHHWTTNWWRVATLRRVSLREVSVAGDKHPSSSFSEMKTVDALLFKSLLLLRVVVALWVFAYWRCHWRHTKVHLLIMMMMDSIREITESRHSRRGLEALATDVARESSEVLEGFFSFSSSGKVKFKKLFI